MAAVAPSGRIEEVPVPELLLGICSSRATGVVRIARAGITKAVYIRKGEIIFAASTDPNDRLGELLLRREVIRLEHLETALANLKKPKRLGTVLVEMGYLEPDKLVWGVIEQARETIFSLFTWSDGEYRFDEGDLPTHEVITLKLSTQEIIFGGIGRIERWDRVLAGVGNLDTPHQVSPARDRILKRLKLDESELALLSALEQPMSARDLCRMDLMPDFRTCRTLWAFKILGVAEPAAGADRMLRQLAMQDEESAATLSLAAKEAPDAGLPEDDAGGEPSFSSAPDPSGGGYTELDPDVEPQAPAAAMLASTPPSRAGAQRDAPTPPPHPPVATATAAEPPAAPRQAAAPRGPAASLGVAPSPGWDPDEAEISAFNDRQRRLFSLMSEKVGQQAAELVRRTLQSLGKELPGIFKGVQASDDGGIDSKGIKANVAASGAKNLTFALDLVIERELEALAGMLGPAVRREVAAKLKGK